MIRSAVLIQYTRVTDRQMDGQTDGIGVAYTALSIASRGKNHGILRIEFSQDRWYYSATHWRVDDCDGAYWADDINPSRSYDVINHVTIRFAICHFQLVVLGNQASIWNGFWNICIHMYLWHDIDLLGSCDVIMRVTIWYPRCYFLWVLHCNGVCICRCFWDNGPQTCWGHDLNLSRSRYVIKTRVFGLSVSELIIMLALFILMQYQNVADRWTARLPDHNSTERYHMNSEQLCDRAGKSVTSHLAVSYFAVSRLL